MINEDQAELLDELTDVLDDSALGLSDMVEPLMFLLTDVVAQLTDYRFDETEVENFANMFVAGVLQHCLIGDSGDNIAIN